MIARMATSRVGAFERFSGIIDKVDCFTAILEEKYEVLYDSESALNVELDAELWNIDLLDVEL